MTPRASFSLPPNPTNNNNDDDADDDYHYIAPQSIKPFNAGIKRKQIAFVPASTTSDLTSTQPQPQPSTTNAGARYLSIVLPSSSTTTTTTTSSCSSSTSTLSTSNSHPNHESSIAHLLSQPHSHPPSSLDRQRKGLKYLEGYGWDPDSRLGLGARNEGIRVPIKAREKRDTAGLGLFADQNDDDDDRDHSVKKMKKTAKSRKEEREGVKIVAGSLNAKQLKKLDEENKKRAEKLRKAFYGEDLSQYLGPGE